MVNRIGLVTAALLLALTSALCARAEFHMGSGDNAYAWERFTGVPIDNTKSQSDQDPVVGPDDGGEYVIVGTDGNELRRRPVTAVEEVGGGTFLVEYNYRGPDRPSMEGNALQAPWVDPLVNLARFDRLIARGGSIYDGHNNTTLPHAAMVSTIDGDPTTSRPMIFTFNPLELVPNTGEVFSGNMASPLIINLGTEMPINRIRIFPRLGRQDDAVTIAAMEEPQPDPEQFGETSFADNYLEWFEIGVTDNDAPIRELPGNRPTQRPGQGQFKRYSETTGFIDSMDTDPNFDALLRTRENINPVIDFRFPVRHERWVSIRPYLPERTWEIAEFEIYGEGYVRRSVYRTHILDFGEPGVAWSKIRWNGKQPLGTQIRVRTRTGNTPDPNLYFNLDVNGNQFLISREEYEDMHVLLQLPLQYDLDNWSFWTPPYVIESGRRDSTLAPGDWEDATRMISLGSSRYLQLEVKLISRFDAAPRLDQIAIQFSENPAAQDVVAEISPTEVASFEAITFTYVIKPSFEAEDTGFDRLEILTHVTADIVRSVKVDGRDIDLLQFPPRIEEDRILVALPFRQAHPDSSAKRIEVVFDVEVLRFGTQFTGWIYDSNDPDLVKQRVRPGNADFRFASDNLSVQTPIGGDLLADLVVAPNPFTPNGDGVNDLTVISYKLREVTAAREVSLEIYDLAGTLVFRRVADPTTHGKKQITWNGRTSAGDVVTPGSYLYRLRLDAANEAVQVGVVAVAY